MESSDYKQVLILPPNPHTSRGMRAHWSANATHFAYPTQNNVVIRSLAEPLVNPIVLTDFPLCKVTSVKYSPDGKLLAVGDDKGKVKIFKVEGAEGKPYTLEKEHSMVAGPVYGLCFTDDGQRFAAGGQGSGMLAKAVLTSSGTKQGDINGPTATVTTIDIKPKPYRMAMGGEEHEINVFDGAPFKHVKTLRQHTSFVSRVAFSPSGKFLVSVSSDKSIVLYDSETLEMIKKIDQAHKKGILDVNWVDEVTIATSSSDNDVKQWNIVEGDLKETRSFNPNEDGKERVENQQLALISTSEQTLTVSLSSNINIWNHSALAEGQRTPTTVIQGHSNNLSALTNANGTLISSDQDGRIFSWAKGAGVPHA